MSTPLRVALVVLLAGCTSVTPSPSAAPTSTVAPTPGATLPPSPPPSPSPTPVPTPAPLISGPDAVALELVTGGLTAPVGVVSAEDGTGRLFVVERAGRVMIVEADGSLRLEPFLDIRAQVKAFNEQGLLGLVFHPQFETNRRLFIHYTRRSDEAIVISEISAGNGQQADPASERPLLVIPDPFVNHNGGQLAFGPDGYLYIGLGDGGDSGDPFDNGQSLETLFGKLLRIDVDAVPDEGKAYAVPADNPYAADGIQPGAGLPEIWAYGLRNPWRFSFDRATGDLYIGDVGQARWEEIDRQPTGSRGGENYGWSVMEGTHCYYYNVCDPIGVEPIVEYGREIGEAVIGGYVYRGSRQPGMVGAYFFGDYDLGTIFTLQVDGSAVSAKPILETSFSITSFGEGEDGELYMVDLQGDLFHLTAN